jgi:hypothetical protein
MNEREKNRKRGRRVFLLNELKIEREAGGYCCSMNERWKERD